MGAIILWIFFAAETGPDADLSTVCTSPESRAVTALWATSAFSEAEVYAIIPLTSKNRGRDTFHFMDDIRLRISRARQRVTAVPDIFIDEYMKDANGEFVKIYLYLLRCLSRDDGSFSVSAMADALDHTERDISRALRYWEKKGLITLEFDGKDELTGITLVDITGDYPEAPAERTSDADRDDAVALTCGKRADAGKQQSSQSAQPQEKDHDPVEIAAAAENDDEIRDTLQAAEIYLGRPVTAQETAKFYSWYRDLHMSPALITHLIESCIEAGHRDFSYMNAVALRWTEKGFKTPEEAEAYGKVYSTTYYAVMKAFGISGRSLSDAETAYVDKWVNEYGFGDGIIAEACRKTILRLGTVSFPYADSILARWSTSGVTSLSDIDALDRKHGQETARDYSVKTGSSAQAQPNPKIHNFPEHNYDFKSIEQQLLNKS